jgi:hypothetical protein
MVCGPKCVDSGGGAIRGGGGKLLQFLARAHQHVSIFLSPQEIKKMIAPPVRIWCAQLKWAPHFCWSQFAQRKLKLRRHDAHDRRSLAIQLNSAPDYRSFTSKSALPKSRTALGRLSEMSGIRCIDGPVLRDFDTAMV